jgi:hypothetical protein
LRREVLHLRRGEFRLGEHGGIDAGLWVRWVVGTWGSRSARCSFTCLGVMGVVGCLGLGFPWTLGQG